MAEEVGPWTKYQRQADPGETNVSPEAAGPWSKYAAKPATKPTERPSVWDAMKKGATQGLTDILFGAEEAASMMPTLLPGAKPGQQRMQADIKQKLKAGETGYQQDASVSAHPLIAGASRIAGNIAGGTAATLPMAGIAGVGAGLAGRAIGGAAGGAAGAMTQPVMGDDYWTQKAKQIASAMLSGGALGAAGGIIGPNISAAAQKIGQIFPNLGRMVSGAESRTVESFQRATANQTLEPLGVTVPKDIQPGHGLVRAVKKEIQDVYNDVIPKTIFRATPKFLTELKEIIKQTNLPPAAQGQQFTNALKTWIEEPLKNGRNSMSGAQYRLSEENIDRTAEARFTHTATPDDRDLGYALRRVQAAMKETLAEINPEYAARLKQADQSWAMYIRLADAAGRRVDGRGEFRPFDLLDAAHKGGAMSRRHFGEGANVMQGFAEAGSDVISGKPSASGLTRFLMAVTGAGAGSMIGGHLGAAVGAGIGEGMGSPVAQAVGRATQTPASRAIGRGVSGLAPGVGAAISPIGP